MLLSASSALAAGLMFLSRYGIQVTFIILLVCVMIIATSITHTFLDFIPSTFLGAPEDDTALSVLPAHSMLLEGKGYQAVFLSAVGSYGAIMSALGFLVLFRFIIGSPVHGYIMLKQIMVFVLIGIVVLMVSTEHKKVPYKKVTDAKYPALLELAANGGVSVTEIKIESTFSRSLGVVLAIFVFFLSGIFGLVILDIKVQSPFGLPATVLFPALSGLFGVATLLVSAHGAPNIPKQTLDPPKLNRGSTTQSVLTGAVAGSTVGFLPGLSAGVATVVAMIFRKEPEREQVIVTLLAINTANAFFVLVALFLILRPRSGAAIVVDQLISVDQWNALIMPQALVYLLIAAIFSAITAFFITLYMGKKFARVFERLPYQKIVISIIVFIFVMVIMFTGLIGLLVLLVATAVGLVPQALGVRRSHAMGVLLLPVIIMLW
jgi:putative membrane protein